MGAVSCLQDISERKRAEERLQETHDRLQLLSRRLVESQETERRHIARELHDEVGQTLTVAEMNLQAVLNSPNAARLREHLNERLHLMVRDDGVGFDVEALRQRAVQGASLGLLSMEERATLVEGSLELKSAPGQGTEVHAWFPLKWRTSES